MHLLAQQSGAQRRGAFRDFHPIQTDPTHPTYSFWPFQPVHTEAFNQSVAVCGIGTLAWPTVHSLHFFFLEILLEICSKHLPHFSIFNFSQCCYFPFPRNQLDPSCQRFTFGFLLLYFHFSDFLQFFILGGFLLSSCLVLMHHQICFQAFPKVDQMSEAEGKRFYLCSLFSASWHGRK